MKGWVDRVFRPGIAYRFEEGDQGEGIPVGLLRASTAVVINTSNTPAAREHSFFGDPLDAIWRRCIFDLCGVKNFHRRMFSVVINSTVEERLGWIEESKILCRTAFQYAAHNNPSHSDGNSAWATFPPVENGIMCSKNVPINTELVDRRPLILPNRIDWMQWNATFRNVAKSDRTEEFKCSVPIWSFG